MFKQRGFMLPAALSSLPRPHQKRRGSMSQSVLNYLHTGTGIYIILYLYKGRYFHFDAAATVNTFSCDSIQGK